MALAVPQGDLKRRGQEFVRAAGGEQPLGLAGAFLGGVGVARGLAAQDDARAAGEVFEGLAEGHLVVLHHEAKGVARGLADEAVVHLLVRHDVHRGVLVGVEGAEADELAALGLERDELADESADVRGLLDLLDLVVTQGKNPQLSSDSHGESTGRSRNGCWGSSRVSQSRRALG